MSNNPPPKKPILPIRLNKSAKNVSSKNPPSSKNNENLKIRSKEDREDQKLKEMVKEIKEPRENRRNVKTANATSHQSIPRNINEYRHLISGFDGGFNITENDIDWVLKLRSPDLNLTEKSKRVTEHLYSFYGKGLECSQLKKETTDLDVKGNINSINHLMRSRIGPTAGLGVVKFETSLRSSEKITPDLVEKERRWSNIPKKDRKEFPTFLPKLKDELKMKQTLKETGDLTKMKLETAFDPDTQYPQYQQKFRYKNLNNLTHLLKPGNTLPMVQWQLSLR